MIGEVKNGPAAAPVLRLLLLTIGMAACAVAGIIFSLPGFADNLPSDNVHIITDTSYPFVARFLLTTQRLIEGTVAFSCPVFENVSGSQPVPTTFLITKPYTRFEFLRLTRKNENLPWQYSYKFNYKEGVPSKKATVDYVYSLPYGPSNHFQVVQSYLGEYSHFLGSDAEYAVDFAMPEGTTVLAARPGVLISYRDDSNKGGSSADFKFDANYLTIRHDDGTYGCYVHLKCKGVLIALGQHVNAGTPIGLSGSTGWSSAPHLHFAVSRVIDGEKITTLPFRMQTPRGVLQKLEKGQDY